MNEKLAKIFSAPVYWASYIILISAVIILSIMAWSVGNLISEQQDLIETQRELTQQAEDRIENLKEDIEESLDDAVEDIRQEVRTPAGQRLETHEIAQRAEALLEELLEELRDE